MEFNLESCLKFLLKGVTEDKALVNRSPNKLLKQILLLTSTRPEQKYHLFEPRSSRCFPYQSHSIDTVSKNARKMLEWTNIFMCLAKLYVASSGNLSEALCYDHLSPTKSVFKITLEIHANPLYLSTSLMCSNLPHKKNFQYALLLPVCLKKCAVSLTKAH